MKNAHQVHRGRRNTLIAAMRKHAGGGLALVPTSPEVARNRDSLYPFRHDSYFYYLTGFPEPEAVVALVAQDDGDKHVLFCREKNLEREIWDGFRYGPDAAKEIFGFDEGTRSSRSSACCPTSRPTARRLFTPVGANPEWDRRIAGTLNEVRARVRTGVAAPDEIVDVRGTLDRMRLVKDAHELALMRKAGDISSQAHRRAMAATRPGMVRVPVGGRARARVPAPGRAIGRLPVDRRERDRTRACCTTARTTGQMHDGDLLLIDAGCEYRGYASTSRARSR
jgi:Xaa-Pro aminopeptidase